MDNKYKLLIAAYIIEVALILILGAIISLKSLGLASYSYTFYILGAIVDVPLIYFLYKVREFDLIKLVPNYINWRLLLAFFMPLLPFLALAGIFFKFHLVYLIFPMVLAAVAVFFGLIIICIFSFGYFIWKNLVSFIVAMCGLILAFAFVQGNIAYEYDIFFTLPLVIAGMCLALAAVPTIFRPMVEQREKLVKLSGLGVVSFIFILLSFFTKNFVTNPVFSLNFLYLYTTLYTIFLVIGLGILFLTIIVFLSIVINWQDQRTKLDRSYNNNIQRGYSTKFEDKKTYQLIPVKDNIVIIKNNFKYYLTFLPVWPREDLIKAEDLQTLLDLTTHWWDIEPLKANIFAGVDNELYKNKIAIKKINSLVKELNVVAPATITNYVTFYKEVTRKTENRDLILAVFNSFIGYNKYYWPNIHNRVFNDQELKHKFYAVYESIKRNKKTKMFKSSINKIKELKTEIDELDGE